MPNMEEVINQISTELPTNGTDTIWISIIDLDYDYERMIPAYESSKHCDFGINGEKTNG